MGWLPTKTIIREPLAAKMNQLVANDLFAAKFNNREEDLSAEILTLAKSILRIVMKRHFRLIRELFQF